MAYVKPTVEKLKGLRSIVEGNRTIDLTTNKWGLFKYQAIDKGRLVVDEYTAMRSGVACVVKPLVDVDDVIHMADKECGPSITIGFGEALDEMDPSTGIRHVLQPVV